VNAVFFQTIQALVRLCEKHGHAAQLARLAKANCGVMLIKHDRSAR